MARTHAAAITHQHDLSGYQRLVRRINHLASTHRAQYERQIVIHPEPGDCPEAWELLLLELRATDNVILTPRPDSSVHVCWLVERPI